MILVTGGFGYVGSALVSELLRRGKRVRVVDSQWFGDPLPPHAALERVVADLRAPEAAWLDDVDGVCHLAALSNDPTSDFLPEASVTCNVDVTRTLARITATHAARRGRSVRFLFASTCSVYHTHAGARGEVELLGEDVPVAPAGFYSTSKWSAEEVLLAEAVDSPNFCPVLLRKGTIFGVAPRMRFDLVVNAFTLAAWSGRELIVHGSGESWRPLLHIRDAVDAYVQLLDPCHHSYVLRGRIFNLLHKNYRILELAHWVAEILEQHRGIRVRVTRDRTGDGSVRSYFVDGRRLTEATGIHAARGTTEAVLELWDALERGDYGAAPAADNRYFNLRHLRERIAAGTLTGDALARATPQLTSPAATPRGDRLRQLERTASPRAVTPTDVAAGGAR